MAPIVMLYIALDIARSMDCYRGGSIQPEPVNLELYNLNLFQLTFGITHY